ncbi:hypothetical protein OAP52_05350 [Hellea sp.]|nr:hypothetical protein [Hellea sp.]MDB4843917.1 hypothetical protein [Hellea sp.]MDC0651469.1 hypothetical protein [Hellea sp.]MDC1061717.1 hypothetical protein [Hellea sp.]
MDTAKKFRVIFYPSVSSYDDLEICSRYIQWGCASLAQNVLIILPVSKDLPLREWPNYCMTVDRDMANYHAKNSEVVIFWNSAAYWGSPAWLRRKAVICDPYASIAATDKFNAWVSSVLEFKLNQTNKPPKEFLRLRATTLAENRDVLIIGPGLGNSSLKETNKLELKNPLCLYVGSAILDTKLTQRFPPDIICASDGASQFSNLAPALDFKARVEFLLYKTKALLIVPAQVTGVIQSHWRDDIKARVLTIPVRTESSFAPNVPVNDSWKTQPTGNVLTTLALPIAQSLSNNLRFSGISLAENQETSGVHWKHANDVNYHRSLTDLLRFEPGSILPVGDYKTKHFLQLSIQLKLICENGGKLLDFSAQPLEMFGDKESALGNSVQKNSIDLLLDICIKKFEIAQNYPSILGVLLITIVLVLSLMMLTFTTPVMTLLMLSILNLCLLVSGLFVLRLRMNRMIAGIEGRLSRQQAIQYENLSERLKPLEETVVSKT